jgi:hypothetical protein
MRVIIIVSSDPTIEGMFISEVAMHEKRPGHIVLRASKVLGTARWDGRDYRVVYRTPAELMKYLKGVPVGVVVIDGSLPQPDQSQHYALLQKTLLAYPDRWEPLGAYPLTKNGVEYGDALLVYRLIGGQTKARAKIHLDMSRILGRSIVQAHNV